MEVPAPELALAVGRLVREIEPGATVLGLVPSTAEGRCVLRLSLGRPPARLDLPRRLLDQALAPGRAGDGLRRVLRTQIRILVARQSTAESRALLDAGLARARISRPFPDSPAPPDLDPPPGLT
jgi:hypothetical protein